MNDCDRMSEEIGNEKRIWLLKKQAHVGFEMLGLMIHLASRWGIMIFNLLPKWQELM